MRSLWSGMISFALVNIPVKLYVATEEKNLDFDLLHRRDLSPIRYARICKSDDEEVAYKDIVRGYEYRKGSYVVIQEEDFKNARPGKTQAIDVVDFVPEKDIDSKLIEKPYYLEPARQVKKTYALFREALKKSGKVAVAKFILRTRERLCLLKPEGSAIVLTQMRFQSEIRSYAGLDLPPENEKIPEREMNLALKLIEQLSEPFHPERFRDTYIDKLREIIEDKARGVEYKFPEPEELSPTAVPDLMSTLKASLEHSGRNA